MLFGIQASQSVELGNIVRSREEEMPPIKTEDRVLWNFKAKALESYVSKRGVELRCRRMADDSLLFLDLSERKEYAEKVENLAHVSSGPTGQLKSSAIRILHDRVRQSSSMSVLKSKEDQLLKKAPDKCLGRKGRHRTRPVLRPGKAGPPGGPRPPWGRSRHGCSEPGTFLGCGLAARRNPRFRLWAEVSHDFFEGLPQVPGRVSESERIQSASQMRPFPGNCPNFPQGNLERTGALSTNLRDGPIEIILIPEALTADQYGAARRDREMHSIAQPGPRVQLLDDRSRSPSYFLRPGEGTKNLRCLQEEMITYADDLKTAVAEVTCEKLDVGRRTIKEYRPTRIWAACRSGNWHVSLSTEHGLSANANLTTNETSGSKLGPIWKAGFRQPRGEGSPQRLSLITACRRQPSFCLSLREMAFCGRPWHARFCKVFAVR